MTNSTVTWSDLELMGFDVVIFGDGSGVNKEGGWACIIYEVDLHRSTPLLGSCSSATNNTMELTPYVQALAHLKRQDREGLSVLICSDSRWVVNGVMDKERRKANRYLWASLEQLEEDFDIEASHHERNSVQPLDWSDTQAGEMREELKERVRSTDLPDYPETQHMSV